MQSASLNIALDKASRLIPLYSSGQRIWIDRWQGQARICHQPAEDRGRRPQIRQSVHDADDHRSHAAGSGRANGGRRRSISRRASMIRQIYESLGVRLRESAVAAIVCDHHLLGRPLLGVTAVRHAAPRMPRSLRRRAARQFRRFDPPGHRDLYAQRHDRHRRTSPAVIGLGSRTLQRRLHGRGWTIPSLSRRRGFRLARKLLDDRAIAVTDIAQELGYSDAANFTRAFRKWTGLAPSYRVELIAGRRLPSRLREKKGTHVTKWHGEMRRESPSPFPLLRNGPFPLPQAGEEVLSRQLSSRADRGNSRSGGG